jgi:hypothetical protein
LENSLRCLNTSRTKELISFYRLTRRIPAELVLSAGISQNTIAPHRLCSDAIAVDIQPMSIKMQRKISEGQGRHG